MWGQLFFIYVLLICRGKGYAFFEDEYCRFHSDCGAEERCVGGICRNVCRDNCLPDMECTVKEHVPYCHCQPGYTLTDIDGLVCQPTAPVRPPGTCATDEDCESDRKCQNQTCVNPCDFRTCYKHLVCYAHQHRGLCLDFFGAVMWIPTPMSEVPPGSVVGGLDKALKEALYVCRARHEGSLLPGKLIITHGLCYVGFKDKEYGERNHEVLTGPNLQWVTPAVGQAPPHAVVGGYDAGETLYICRGESDGYTIIGKVSPKMEECWVSYGGQGVRLARPSSSFEVLVQQ